MYLIKSNNIFELEAVKDLLLQKQFKFIKDSNENYFGEIKINYEKNSIKIFYNQNSFTCDLPVSFKYFFNNLLKLINNQKINFGSLHYSPLNQELLSLNNKIKLTDTHNIIISEIIKNQHVGLDKNKLYRLIWPRDYEIQISKLDTHLTNVKKLLKKEFNYELIYKSTRGLLVFQID